MMSSLSPRERVNISLSHQEPDRVPIAIGGGPYGLVDSLYLKLIDLLDLGAPVQPFRRGHSISYMDDRLLEALGSDLRYVYPGASPSSPSQPTSDPNTFVDSFGQSWKRSTPYYYASEGMLASIENSSQIDSVVDWPDVNDPHWITGVAERAKMLYDTTDCYIVARMVNSHGPFQTACDLRGSEQFMMDMITNPPFADALLARITSLLVSLTLRYLEACGNYIEMIELPGDDYAGNSNLIISPAMFRRFIKPALQQLINAIKEYRPNLKVMFHSDGAIQRLIPELIELGVDVIHPLEPLPANDLVQVKKLYGQQIAFLGGIDIRHALTGNQQQVKQEVYQRIQQLAPGGGYILAPSNHLQTDVPPENVLTLFETARVYGKYPIRDDPDKLSQELWTQ